MTIPAPTYTQQFGTSEFEEARSIAIDGDRNIYLTGNTFGDLGGTNAGSSDVWVSKHAVDGTLLWSQQIGTSEFDTARDLDLDALGNVYIAGSTYGGFNGDDEVGEIPFLAKFSNDGELLWLRQLDAPGIDSAVAWDIEVDDQGNAYVSTQGNQPSLWVYDTNGDFIWNNADSQFESFATGSVVNTDGDVFVVGLDALAKYDSDGALIWGVETVSSGSGHDVTLDSFGNVYVVGRTFGNVAGDNAGGNDIWLAKYDIDGNSIWIQQIGSEGDEFANGIIVDDDGQIYVSGRTSGNLGTDNVGGLDAFLAQFDSDGQLLDVEQWGTAEDEDAVGVQTDGFGNFYLGGWTDGTLGESSAGDRDVWFRVLNDPTLPQLSISDGAIAEGDTGLTSINVTVTLSKPSFLPITVDYATEDEGAIAPDDYQSASGTLLFNPGETTQAITLDIVADQDVEGDETFSIILGDPVNATLQDEQGDVIIINDDEPIACEDDDLIAWEDAVHGTSNDDELIGSDCSDWLNGRAGNDVLFGKVGSDLLRGGRGNDLIIGGNGDDRMKGNSGDDVLRGGDGDDLLRAGRSKTRDRLRSGDGSDVYILHHKGFSVVRDFDVDHDTFRVRQVESIDDLQFIQSGTHTQMYLGDQYLARFANTEALNFTAELYASF